MKGLRTGAAAAMNLPRPIIGLALTCVITIYRRKRFRQPLKSGVYTRERGKNFPASVNRIAEQRQRGGALLTAVRKSLFQRLGAVAIDGDRAGPLELFSPERAAGEHDGGLDAAAAGGFDVPDRVAERHRLVGSKARFLERQREDVGLGLSLLDVGGAHDVVD